MQLNITVLSSLHKVLGSIPQCHKNRKKHTEKETKIKAMETKIQTEIETKREIHRWVEIDRDSRPSQGR